MTVYEENPFRVEVYSSFSRCDFKNRLQWDAAALAVPIINRLESLLTLDSVYTDLE